MATRMKSSYQPMCYICVRIYYSTTWLCEVGSGLCVEDEIDETLSALSLSIMANFSSSANRIKPAPREKKKILIADQKLALHHSNVQDFDEEESPQNDP